MKKAPKHAVIILVTHDEITERFVILPSSLMVQQFWWFYKKNISDFYCLMFGRKHSFHHTEVTLNNKYTVHIDWSILVESSSFYALPTTVVEILFSGLCICQLIHLSVHLSFIGLTFWVKIVYNEVMVTSIWVSVNMFCVMWTSRQITVLTPISLFTEHINVIG